MMKPKQIISMAVVAAGAMMFASCNVNDEIQSDVNRAVRFTGNIGGQVTVTPGTRASGIEWGTDDEVGVFMVGHGGTSVPDNVSNKKYTVSGTSLSAAGGVDIYYPVDGAVDFIAYYPYSETWNDLSEVDINIGDQTEQAKFDLLYAKADNDGAGYTKDYGSAVGLQFDHKLAKVVFNCKKGNGLASLDGMTVRIKGMNSRGTFNLANGVVVPTNNSTETEGIAARELSGAPSGYLKSYDAIIMPGAYDANAVTFEFTVGGDTFTWTIDKAENAKFESGNEYTYAVTVTRRGVTMSGTISPWKTDGNDRGSVVAD